MNCSMNFEIVATPDFRKSLKALAKKYRSIKSDLKRFSESLKENPFQGTELTPGIRKIRMAIESKNRGKSGGARVITYTVLASEIDGHIYLIDIYDKSEFTSVDIKLLQKKVKEIEQ